MEKPGSFLEEPQVLYLQRLLEDVRHGNVLVPRFQRQFIWKDSDRLRLLDSIANGIPIGSLLVWRTNTAKLATFPRIGGIAVQKPISGRVYTYLLDGHQRVSTLFSAMSMPPDRQGVVDPEDWELIAGDVFYDLVEEKFLITKKFELVDKSYRLAFGLPNLLPLYYLFHSTRLLHFQREISLLDSKKSELWINRADALAERFRNYKIAVIPIVTDQLDTAVTAFQRVNSSGVRMSDVHMVRALTYSSNYDLSGKIEESRERLAEVGWGDLDDKYLIGIVRIREGLDVTKPNAEETAKLLKKSPDLLDEATQAAVMAANWLWKNCSIPSPDFIPYSYQFVLLAAALADHRMKRKDATVRWIWNTALSGHFGSIYDSELKESFQNLCAVMNGDESYLNIFNKTEIKPLEEKCNFRMARVKIIAVQMLRRRLLSIQHEHVNYALSYVRAKGAQCMGRILKCSDPEVYSGIANRILLISDDERGVYSWPNVGGVSREEQNSLVIGQRALSYLRSDDVEAFAEQRHRDLQGVEREFRREFRLL